MGKLPYVIFEVWHFAGSCKIGSDPMAVVDIRLKVHGINQLRVVDASIMPTLVGGLGVTPTRLPL